MWCSCGLPPLSSQGSSPSTWYLCLHPGVHQYYPVAAAACPPLASVSGWVALPWHGHLCCPPPRLGSAGAGTFQGSRGLPRCCLALAAAGSLGMGPHQWRRVHCPSLCAAHGAPRSPRREAHCQQPRLVQGGCASCLLPHCGIHCCSHTAVVAAACTAAAASCSAAAGAAGAGMACTLAAASCTAGVGAAAGTCTAAAAASYSVGSAAEHMVPGPWHLWSRSPASCHLHKEAQTHPSCLCFHLQGPWVQTLPSCAAPTATRCGCHQ